MNIGAGFPHEWLSRRESGILRRVDREKSLNEFADELSTSNKTVKPHKMRIMQKLNFNSNTERLHYAIDHGLEE